MLNEVNEPKHFEGFITTTMKILSYLIVIYQLKTHKPNDPFAL